MTISSSTIGSKGIGVTGIGAVPFSTAPGWVTLSGSAAASGALSRQDEVARGVSGQAAAGGAPGAVVGMLRSLSGGATASGDLPGAAAFGHTETLSGGATAAATLAVSHDNIRVLSGPVDASAALARVAEVVRGASGEATADGALAYDTSRSYVETLSGDGAASGSLVGLASYPRQLSGSSLAQCSFGVVADVSRGLSGGASASASLTAAEVVVTRRRLGGRLTKKQIEALERKRREEWEADRKRDADKRKRLDDILKHAARELLGQSDQDETPPQAPQPKKAAVIEYRPAAVVDPDITKVLRLDPKPKTLVSGNVWDLIPAKKVDLPEPKTRPTLKIIEAPSKAEAEEKAQREAEESDDEIAIIMLLAA